MSQVWDRPGMEMERDTSPLGTRGQWPVPHEVVRWEAPLGTHTDPEGRTKTHSHQPEGRVRGSAARGPEQRVECAPRGPGRELDLPLHSVVSGSTHSLCRPRPTSAQHSCLPWRPAAECQSQGPPRHQDGTSVGTVTGTSCPS